MQRAIWIAEALTAISVGLSRMKPAAPTVEPSGNLDSSNGASVMELLLDLHRAGTTICRVTHDESYARQAGRTIHLLDGRIVDENEERN